MSLDSLNKHIALSRVTAFDVELCSDNVKTLIDSLRNKMSDILDVITIILGIVLKYLIDIAPLFFNGSRFRPFRIWHFRRLIQIAHHGWNMVEAITDVVRNSRDKDKLEGFRATLNKYYQDI